MRSPKSMLHGSVARRLLRRPSPAMMVAAAALFMSLGGVSYAAVSLPANSVHTRQLHNFAVTDAKIANGAVNFRKIKPSSVGAVRIVKNAVQLRVNGTCITSSQAITSIDVNGGVTCGSTGTTVADSGAGKQVAIATGTAATTVTSYQLAAGSEYLVQATAAIEVSSATGVKGNHVTVTCNLAAGTASTAQSATVNVDSSGDTEYTSLPLSVTAPSSTSAITATLSCTQSSTGGTGTPAVAAQATIYGLGINPATTTTPAA